MQIGICFDAGVFHTTRYRRKALQIDVLLFPELMNGGYARLRKGLSPHSLADDFCASLRSESKKTGCTIVAGSIPLKRAHLPQTNTSLVFRNGKLIHQYDKIHLFKPTGDTRFFSPGKLAVKTFRLQTKRSSLHAGVVICYDLRFPELIRSLALQKMSVLFVPARWPKSRDEAWRSLLKARAIENQIFVVGCNSLDKEGGYSYAFDPFGKMIFSNRGDTRKLFHTFNINPAKIRKSHELHQNVREAVFLRKYFG